MSTYEPSKAPICICGLQMVERKNKATGEVFYGCTKFPLCRHTEQVDPLAEWRSQND